MTGDGTAARHPALHGLVDQLPPRVWTIEQRAKWLAALELVLDFSVKIKTPTTPEDADADDEALG